MHEAAVGNALSPTVDQSWTWIGSFHGLDWIGFGQDFEETLWIGLGPITAILCFFIYIFSILTTDKRCRYNTIMCILADFNRL